MNMFIICSLYGSRYSRIDQVNFFNGCLSQILIGPFLNSLTHMLVFLRQKWRSFLVTSDQSCLGKLTGVLGV